ncbi:MAG: hypothetical protein ACT4PZ_02150 [Panacagrimonas sp.]
MSPLLLASLLIAAIGHIAIGLVATRRLLATEWLDQDQKRVQLVLLWSIPFVGAWLVLRILSEREDETQTEQPAHTGEENAYVRDALEAQVRVTVRLARRELRDEIRDEIRDSTHPGPNGD